MDGLDLSVGKGGFPKRRGSQDTAGLAKARDAATPELRRQVVSEE